MGSRSKIKRHSDGGSIKKKQNGVRIKGGFVCSECWNFRARAGFIAKDGSRYCVPCVVKSYKRGQIR